MIDTPGKQVTEIALSNLLLDMNNPRFGGKTRTTSQAEILDLIVEQFGVDDVLSSLAINGYFTAEPLVCRRLDNTNLAVVAEGNRRLAACLILTEEERAKNQIIRTRKYKPIWENHGKQPINPVPIILFEAHEQEQAILSYLGVRHISSAQQWDSYAKAAWVARVVDAGNSTVEEVAAMIGDRHKTVSRLLEGYHFIGQLIDRGIFQPENSIRKGRGSVTQYPFSWVYTILGYASVRAFLQLSNEGPKRAPVPDDNLLKAELLIRAMFGDRSKGRSAAINDSRELSALASIVASREKVTLLEQGKTLQEIDYLTQPVEDRLRQGLADVREIQAELVARLSENELPSDAAQEFVPLTGRNRKLAIELDKKVREAAHGEEDED